MHRATYWSSVQSAVAIVDKSNGRVLSSNCLPEECSSTYSVCCDCIYVCTEIMSLFNLLNTVPGNNIDAHFINAVMCSDYSLMSSTYPGWCLAMAVCTCLCSWLDWKTHSLHFTVLLEGAMGHSFSANLYWDFNINAGECRLNSLFECFHGTFKLWPVLPSIIHHINRVVITSPQSLSSFYSEQILNLNVEISANHVCESIMTTGVIWSWQLLAFRVFTSNVNRR